MNILVIEENLSRRKIIHRKLQLTKINSHIVLVKSFTQALGILKRTKFDVVMINQQLFNFLPKKQIQALNAEIVLLTLKKDLSKKKYNQLLIDAKIEEYKKVLTEVKKQIPVVKPLSKREKEILFLISHGLNGKKIASNLSIKETTIKTHLRRIRIKLHTLNRSHSVAKALRQGSIH